jgi:preprotein translocase subunit SecE
MGPPAGLAPRAGIALALCVLTANRKAHMAKVSPFKFLQEVRSEMAKVTWPSRRETAITTAMVFVMVAIASVFFLVADQIIRVAITFLLGLGG